MPYTVGVAVLKIDFFSDVLELSTSMTVVLPQPTTEQIGMTGRAGSGEPPPVLYLLHGLSDDHSIWLRRTSIERYVAPVGLAVVMPQVHRSFYLDGVHTGDYWTFLTEELPSVVHRFLRVSDGREDTFVAGLSMGGYGALRWALRQPERFAAAASLSGALDVRGDRHEPPRFPRMWQAILGEADDSGVAGVAPPSDVPLLGDVDDLDPGAAPPLYVACGTDDHLFGDSERFVDAARGRGLDVTWAPSAGDHEWGFWDRTIQDVLAWLPLGGDGDTQAGQ